MAAPPEEQQPLEPLKYQTWVLKVSIHCEGCKRKVKRILQAIEGVYMITIESKQQKVTVTGNVEPEVLIKKLMRTGKHAEMWPMSPTESDQKPGNDNKLNNGGGDDTEAEDSDLDDEQVQQQPPSDHQHGVRFFLGDQRPPNPNMMMHMGPLQGQPMPPPMNPNGGSGGGGAKKKKKKKKKKKSGTSSGGGGRGGGNNPPPTGPGGNSGATLGPLQGHGPLGGIQMTGIQYQDLNRGLINHSYLPQAHYPNHQAAHMPLTAPVYSMSYNTMQPGRSHGPYYRSQAMQPYSYAYDETESYDGPVVSFDMINDENPNWCSVM